MGLGGWIDQHVVDPVEHETARVVDAGGDGAESVLSGAEHWAGGVVDAGAHDLGGVLHDVGADGAAGWVDRAGDTVADDLGAGVAELDLGQTDDPTQLVHGDVGALHESAGHLRKLAAGFADTASGLRRIDPGDWSGSAADAFRAAYPKAPAGFDGAGDACRAAAGALSDYAGTVAWAQGQAAEAIDLYRQGVHASQVAVASYNQQVETYNAAANAYNAATSSGRVPPGSPPNRPKAFHDPGTAIVQRARRILADARDRRDGAAASAQGRVASATRGAPAEPSFHDRMFADVSDAAGVVNDEAAHFGAGVLKGVGGLVRFARSVNPTDPYNLTHPAEYLAAMSAMAAGLLHATNHPGELVKALVGTGWRSDPAEALGKLVPNLALAVGTDGVGTAGDVTADVAERAAVGEGEAAAGRSAVGLAEDPERLAQVSRGRDTVTACGDPVDVATGAVLLDQVDVELPGVLPLVLARRHISDWRYGRWFGPTWASTLDERLDVGENEVMLVRGDGVVLCYPHPTGEQPVYPRDGEAWPMWATATGGYRVSDPGTGQVRHYPSARYGQMPLAAVTDPAGNRVVIDRDEAGAPVQVRHSGGYRVLVDTDGGRVTGLAVATGEGGSEGDSGVGDGDDAVPVAQFRYEQGSLVGVVGESGQTLALEYDRDGRLTGWTDRNGTAYTYRYDDEGRCVDQGGPGGIMSARYAYTDLPGGARETVMVDAEGGQWSYTSNRRGEVVQQVDPLGGRTRSVWDERHRLVARTDPLGRTTRWVRDRWGNVTRLVRPDGATRRVDYLDAGGRPQPGLVTDVDGSTWQFTYDGAGNRASVTDPARRVTRFGYDERGGLTEVADPAGGVTRAECDGAGLPVMVTGAAGGVTRLIRDRFGRAVRVDDPAGGVTRLSWSPQGRLLGRTGPDGGSESFEYDGEGNLTERVDAAGRVTRATYTHFDLVASQEAGDGSVTRFGYDRLLRLTSVANPQGLTWRYAYDPVGRLVAETDFDGRTLSYEYDAAGQLVSRVNGAGQRVRVERDVLGRAARIRADGQVTEYLYDPVGRLLRSTSPGVEVVLLRGALGRVRSDVVNGRAVTSTFDTAGRRTRRVTPAGVQAVWERDVAGRAVSVSVAGRVLGFDRDPVGREVRRDLAGAAALDQVWDPASRLAGQTLTTAPAPGAGPTPGGMSRLEARLGRVRPGPAGGHTGAAGAGGVAGGESPGPRVLAQRGYTWEPGGRLVGVDEGPGRRRSFALDGLGRVTGVTGADWSGADWVEAYGYDLGGNITQATVPAATTPGVHAQHGAERREYMGTRLVRSGRDRYSYDRQGRLVSRTRARLSRKPDRWKYAWDGLDRLVGVTTPDGTAWRYLYDGLGRRVAKQRLTTEGAVVEETWFAWDGDTLAEQTTTIGTAGVGLGLGGGAGDRDRAVGSRETLSWVHDGLVPVAQTRLSTPPTSDGPAHGAGAGDARYGGDGPVGQPFGDGGWSQEEVDGEFFAIVTDLVGAPSELVDETGGLVWRARRTVWGAPEDPAQAGPVPLRFPGQYADPETGLCYNRHRYYDPGTGRYTSPDPLGLAAAPNPVAYVDNPTTAIDPLGLAPCAPDASGAAAETGATGAIPSTDSLANDVADATGGAVKANKGGYTVNVPNGSRGIAIRIMDQGGGRTNYYRISIPGKATYTIDGTTSTDPALTHIDIGQSSLDDILRIVHGIPRGGS